MSVQSGSKALNGRARTTHSVGRVAGTTQTRLGLGFFVPQYLLAVGKRGGVPVTRPVVGYSPDGSNDQCGLPPLAGELQGLADGVVAVVGDEGQGEHGHRHGNVLEEIARD